MGKKIKTSDEKHLFAKARWACSMFVVKGCVCVCVDETTVLVSILKSNHSKPTDSVLRTQQINKNPIPTFPIKKTRFIIFSIKMLFIPVGVWVVLVDILYSILKCILPTYISCCCKPVHLL